MTNTNKLKLLSSWSPVLLCMLAIFILSAQPASVSNSASKRIVRLGVEATINMTRVEVVEAEKLEIISSINSVGREYMHGAVFFVLGLLAQRAVVQSGGKGIAPVKAFALCALYGVTDEIHQLFVPGRAFELSDLAMDAAGSLIGIVVLWAIYRAKAARYRLNTNDTNF